MNEMTESAPKGRGKGKGKKAGEAAITPVEAQVSRLLMRAIFAQEWAAANPDATPEQRKAAWKEQRAAITEKNQKNYRHAVASLKRSGVTITISEEAAAETDDGDEA
jgi:hypothetical protein